MSGNQGSGEKSFAPSQRKIIEARKKGQIARTTDLGAWLAIAFGAAVLPFTCALALETLSEMLTRAVALVDNPDLGSAIDLMQDGLLAAALLVAPVAAVTVVVAILATGVQGGIHLATKAAKPQFSRLNVLKGIKNLLSMKTVWEAIKTTLRTAVVAIVLWKSVVALAPVLIGSGAMSLGEVIQLGRDGVATLVRTAVVAGLVVAAADYMVSRRRTMKDLRMTAQEVKEENKQMEGDPQLKSAVRSRQMAMSRNRMMNAVANADVVLVNPTHYAVALRYQPDDQAPVVVAKGQALLAARIRERATENNVPLVHDPPLTRALHAACELGQHVPPSLYQAVATVLAFVAKLRERGAAAGMHEVPQQRLPARPNPATAALSGRNGLGTPIEG